MSNQCIIKDDKLYFGLSTTDPNTGDILID